MTCVAQIICGAERFKHPWNSPSRVFAGWAGVEVTFFSSEQNIMSLKTFKSLSLSAKWGHGHCY